MRSDRHVCSIWGLTLISAQLCRKNLQLALSYAAVVLILGGATPALAVSGETPEGLGVYEIPQGTCDALSDEVAANPDLHPDFNGDVLFTCDADRKGCRLTFQDLDEGLGLGFCENKFDLNPYLYEGGLEENVVIEATSFGNDIGVLRPSETDLDGTGVDILCETFADGGVGVKACRKIIEDPEASGGPPACDALIPTVASDCVTAQDLVAGSVTGDPNPNLSFGLFIDVDLAGQPGSEALLVCPGFRWECADPADPDFPDENGVTVQYQFTKYIIDTPGCIKVGGTCYRYRP
jgi:hypothetical protein